MDYNTTHKITNIKEYKNCLHAKRMFSNKYFSWTIFLKTSLYNIKKLYTHIKFYFNEKFLSNKTSSELKQKT